METNVGSDNFQDLKIHRNGVFRPDLSLRSGQGISSPDVVSRLGRKLAPARTHAQISSNSRTCGSPLGHLPSSCRLTLARTSIAMAYSVLWRCDAFVCVSGFRNRKTTPLKFANEYFVLSASASRLVFTIHTVWKSHLGILIFRRRNT